MLGIGVLHGLTCLHHDNPDSTSIREVYEAWVMPDPARDPTVSWSGPIRTGCWAMSSSYMSRPTRREENQAPANPRDEPHETDPHSPLFCGEAHKDYSKDRKKLEVIFRPDFHNWTKPHMSTAVTHRYSASINHWKGKWDANQCWRR
jgi:hypothetical protein